MRLGFALGAATVVVAPSVGHTNDLAGAVSYIRGVMGEEIIVGCEEFVDYDPDEALPLLLARDVTPGLSPQGYVDRDRSGGAAPHFESLGPDRLSYERLAGVITRASERSGMPVALLDAVIRTESGYRPRAVSRAGARGLMQLMPGTAQALGVVDAFDPEQNVMAGARYLRRLYDRFGSIPLALAAYNAGPTAVKEHGGIPPFEETKRYVRTVLERARGFEPTVSRRRARPFAPASRPAETPSLR